MTGIQLSYWSWSTETVELAPDWRHKMTSPIAATINSTPVAITKLIDGIPLIRTWVDSVSGANQDWLTALQDEQIGQALVLIYREPQHPWTVASLAATVNLSRSAFSARFTELVGQPAMRYLTGWRMQRAHTLIRETSLSLAAIAARVGYESEAAFSRAFKRRYDFSLGSLRRAERSTMLAERA